MLVTFSCSVYADITLFGDIAVRLLRMMGHSGSVPGAILADDVGAALERLRAALKSLAPPPENATDEEGEPIVSLHNRALPLIELLTAAKEANCNVMWDKYG